MDDFGNKIRLDNVHQMMSRWYYIMPHITSGVFTWK